MSDTVHACIAKAVHIVDKRGSTLGVTPGWSEEKPENESAYLIGTDLREAELVHFGDVLAQDFLTTMSELAQEGRGDEILPALAGFWRHGALCGAIAVAECRS